MILPTMSWLEIYREAIHDLDCVLIKSKYDYEQRLRRKLIKEKLERKIDVINYLSPNRNRWILYNVIKNYKKVPICVPVCYYYDNFGLNALHPVNITVPKSVQGFIRFNAHCIKRYRSRLMPELTDPIKLLDHLNRNIIFNNSILKKVKLENNDHMYMPVTGGGFLAVLHIEEHLLEMKTFISDELMRSKQIKKAMELRNLRLEDFPEFNWIKRPC